MENWKKANEEINKALAQGSAMEAFERYYDKNIVMQENETPPRVGKDLNREQCNGFVSMFPDLKLDVLSVAYGEKLSIQEVYFTYTNENGEKVRYPEIAVRHWLDDKVIKEKFYYAS